MKMMQVIPIKWSTLVRLGCVYSAPPKAIIRIPPKLITITTTSKTVSLSFRTKNASIAAQKGVVLSKVSSTAKDSF